MVDATPLFHHADADAPARLLIVAELGVNHDGEAQRAAALIDAAAKAGADAIKLQYFVPDRLLSSEARLAAYQQGAASDPYELLAARQLSWETWLDLRQKARAAGAAFIVTPFSPADIDDLAGLDVDAVKIASPDAVNTPLLAAAGALGKPMLISTGTCCLAELQPAAALLASHSSGGAMLQCVSSYPTSAAEAALGGIAALLAAFDMPTGYSDHTTLEQTGALAVAAGACVLEKHLTDDRDAAGPDHAVSLDPTGFARYVEQARQAATMVGPIRKAPLAVETDVSGLSRQSLCAVRDLPADHVIEQSDLTIKRPGNGVPANAWSQVVGRTTARPVAVNTLLQWADLR